MGRISPELGTSSISMPDLHRARGLNLESILEQSLSGNRIVPTSGSAQPSGGGLVRHACQ